MTYADSDRRRDLITGLRDLAKLLESCPDIPAPYTLDVLIFPPDGSDVGIRAEIDRIAAILSVTANDETARHGHYTASKSFGPVMYRAVAISSRSRAFHDARNSYAGNVITPMDKEG
jgi:hypothetical protein